MEYVFSSLPSIYSSCEPKLPTDIIFYLIFGNSQVAPETVIEPVGEGSLLDLLPGIPISRLQSGSRHNSLEPSLFKLLCKSKKKGGAAVAVHFSRNRRAHAPFTWQRPGYENNKTKTKDGGDYLEFKIKARGAKTSVQRSVLGGTDE